MTKMKQPLKGRVGSEKGSIYYGFFNPQVIKETPAKDRDLIGNLGYLYEAVEARANPNILQTLGNSEFIAYVVKFNEGQGGDVQFQCTPGSTSGLTVNADDRGPDSVNALIIELNPAYPVPPSIDRRRQGATSEVDPNPCKDLAILNSERISSMAPRFVIPAHIKETLRAGNIIKVRLSDISSPSRGGVVTDVVKTQSDEILMAPLIDGSKSKIKDLAKRCQDSADFITGSANSGDSAIQPESTPSPNPQKIVVGSLVIDKMDPLMLDPQTYTVRKRPMRDGGDFRGSIVFATDRIHRDLGYGYADEQLYNYQIYPDGTVTEWLDPATHLSTLLNPWGGQNPNKDVILVRFVGNSDVVINKGRALIAYLMAKWNIPRTLRDTRSGRLLKEAGNELVSPNPATERMLYTISALAGLSVARGHDSDRVVFEGHFDRAGLLSAYEIGLNSGTHRLKDTTFLYHEIMPSEAQITEARHLIAGGSAVGDYSSPSGGSAVA